MTTPSDDRTALAKAYQRASRGVAIAVGMVFPGMMGYFLDSRIGTVALFTIIGFGTGMSYGIWELVRLGRTGDQHGESVPRSGAPNSPKHDSDVGSPSKRC